MARQKKENLTLILKNELQTVHTSTADFQQFIQSKVDRIYEIIQSTFISLEMYSSKELFSNSEINQNIDILHDLYAKAQLLEDNQVETVEQIDKVIDDLQKIFDKLSYVLSNSGTSKIEDILYVVFGANYDIHQSMTNQSNDIFESKIRLIAKYIMPIGYKNIPWKNPVKIRDETNTCSDKIIDTTAQLEQSLHMECFEPSTLFSSLHQSIYGLRIVVHNQTDKKTIIIHGLSENIPIYCITNEPFIQYRLDEIEDYFEDLITDTRNQTNETDIDLDKSIIRRWIETFTLKDLLIYSLSDLYKKYTMMMTDVKYVKQNRVEVIIKYFFDMDVTSRRKMLSHLFTFNKDNEVQYIGYMLYDLIGSADNSQPESLANYEQKQIYDSLPWKLKMYFKETMVNTIQHTQETISKCDVSKVSLEQQVILMRTNDKIKERAMSKLKEIKGKSDDQGSKAKQYLEGLIKVPFGIYRKEPILMKMDYLNAVFSPIIQEYHKLFPNPNLGQKTKYTMYEMIKTIQMIEQKLTPETSIYIRHILSKINRATLIKIVAYISQLSGRPPFIGPNKKHELYTYIMQFLDTQPEMPAYSSLPILKMINPVHPHISICDQTAIMQSEIKYVHNAMDQMKERLDKSIYGHEYAKSQILKIVGQWINGEQNGYCFGFEGSPGIGKTSLAKRGLAQCLQDEEGEPRPFSFIALGGSCNGSTLEGHNYTYVNSTWGKIVDVLMESKCMNPIIYIDELDKVSKTEQGREIIGILTHLIDTTQNDEYQDRYFNGIPFDMSKALFIFSYNDPEQIDRILLDRIHRIKFDNLSWTDKLVIVKKFILPDLNKKMGFEQTVELSDEVVEHIVEQYTMEPGIRKLKEILFDLYGEINVELLRNNDTSSIEQSQLCLPIKISVQDLGIKYLKKHKKIHDKKIHTAPLIGMINGMWANALGKGGIIPIETMFFPSSTFLDLKLTGLQGDVMKESMNVAKSLAWSITPIERQKVLIAKFEATRNQGLHIHCPEGAVSKDGPSAGAAITLAIYSLLNEIPIKNTVAITGETNLQGEVTAIGGLEFKIFGSIRAGIKTILYPKSNQTDFDDFIEKYGKNLDTTTIKFIAVEHVKEAIPHFMP